MDKFTTRVNAQNLISEEKGQTEAEIQKIREDRLERRRKIETCGVVKKKKKKKQSRGLPTVEIVATPSFNHTVTASGLPVMETYDEAVLSAIQCRRDERMKRYKETQRLQEEKSERRRGAAKTKTKKKKKKRQRGDHTAVVVATPSFKHTVTATGFSGFGPSLPPSSRVEHRELVPLVGDHV